MHGSEPGVPAPRGFLCGAKAAIHRELRFMVLRDSAKIVLAVGASIGVIVGLHFGVFRDRAEEFRSAKSSYDEKKNSYAMQGSARSLNEIFKYRYETLRRDNKYWTLMRDLKLAIPTEFQIGAENTVAVRTFFETFLSDLEKRRDDNEGARLLFLQTPRTPQPLPVSWELATGLPAAIQGRSPEDYVSRLKDAFEVLKVLEQSSDLYQRKQQEYRSILRDLGLDLERRDQIKERFGELAALVHTLNRIDIVRKALPPNFWPADRDEQSIKNELYDLFRVEWPTYPVVNTSYPYYRQAQNLLKMLDAADQAGVQEIRRVVMRKPTATFFIADAAAPAAGAAAPTPAPPAAGTDPRFAGGGNRGASNQASSRPAQPEAAIGAAIEITARGTNLSNMTYLHTISRTELPFEVDSISIRSVDGPGGQQLQELTAFVNTLVIPYSGTTILIAYENQIEEAIIQNLKERVELAPKAGARELAIEDGIIDDKANIKPEIREILDKAAAAAAAPKP